MKSILIISGEHSGDNLGSGLMKELKALKPGLNFFGIGGKGMQNEGLESFADIEELNVIGLFAALFKYRKLKKIANGLIQKLKEKNCDTAILIDYPGFNLALASMLKNENPNFKIIFYVSPQIWAWRFKRIHKIKKLVNLMILLFPFEKKIYDKYEVPNVYVGHTVVNNVKIAFENGKPLDFPSDSIVISLMPGSRTTEISKLLEPLLETSLILNQYFVKKNKKIHFLVPNINDKEEKFILSKISEYKELDPKISLEYIYNNTCRCIEKSDLVVLASGTATLEVALFEKPMIILYKTSFFTHFIGKRIVSVPYIGLVNVLSEKFICKEFLQNECNAINISQEAKRILEDSDYRNTMIDYIKKVKEDLGQGDSSKLAANAIVKLISSSP
jgi:lipid-A-disaccharide synthase